MNCADYHLPWLFRTTNTRLSAVSFYAYNTEFILVLSRTIVTTHIMRNKKKRQNNRTCIETDESLSSNHMRSRNNEQLTLDGIQLDFFSLPLVGVLSLLLLQLNMMRGNLPGCVLFFGQPATADECRLRSLHLPMFIKP